MSCAKNSIFSLLTALCCFATSALGAEFHLIPYSRLDHVYVTLDGPIVKGDADKFRTRVREAIQVPGIERLIVVLDSPGGSVSEAIEIAQIVRDTLATTYTNRTRIYSRSHQTFTGEVPKRWATTLGANYGKTLYANQDEPLPELSKCWSACTIIFFAGVIRQVWSNEDGRDDTPGARAVDLPTIGVHRPMFATNAYGDLSPAQAQDAYSKMLERMSGSLLDMGASEEFVRRTMATPSTEIDLISETEMESLYKAIEPFFEDWLAAKCGTATDFLSEEELLLYRMYSDFWLDNRLFWDSESEQEVAMVQEFGLAGVNRIDDVSDRVGRRHPWVQLCEDTVVRTVRHEWALDQP